MSGSVSGAMRASSFFEPSREISSGHLNSPFRAEQPFLEAFEVVCELVFISVTPPA